MDAAIVTDEPYRGYVLDSRKAGLAWVVEREVDHGFERIRIRFLTMHLEHMVEKEVSDNGYFYRAVCSIYPLDPRPSPSDIVSVAIEKIKTPLHHVILSIVLRRGHYIGGPPSSFPEYDWEEYQNQRP